MGKQQLLLLSIAVGLGPAAASSCGGEVEASVDDQAPPEFWPEGAQAEALDALLGDVLDVPGGTVRVGSWLYDPRTKKLTPGACDEPRAFSSIRMRVSSFRLMRLEVSNEVYAKCIQLGRCSPPDADLSDDPSGFGAWSDPRRTHKPVATSYVQARAFCQAFGGELPTHEQWIRATEGDSGSFGIADLTAEHIRCVTGESASSLCDGPLGSNKKRQFAPLPVRDGPRGTALPDVGANARDVGPFGHMDLFASAGEWVRWSFEDRVDCVNENRLADELYVPPSLVADGGSVMQLAFDLWAADIHTTDHAFRAGQPDEFTHAEQDGREMPEGRGEYFTGFRCAFPPRATN